MTDELDQKIIAVLMKNARATAVEIGKQVGVHANTVSYRLTRLKESGLLFFSVRSPLLSYVESHKLQHEYTAWCDRCRTPAFVLSLDADEKGLWISLMCGHYEKLISFERVERVKN